MVSAAGAGTRDFWMSQSAAQSCQFAPRCEQVCPHGRQRSLCKECGGISICPHGRQRHRCKECGGKGICEHGRERYKCKECPPRTKGVGAARQNNARALELVTSAAIAEVARLEQGGEAGTSADASMAYQPAASECAMLTATATTVAATDGAMEETEIVATAVAATDDLVQMTDVAEAAETAEAVEAVAAAEAAAAALARIRTLRRSCWPKARLAWRRLGGMRQTSCWKGSWLCRRTCRWRSPSRWLQTGRRR